VPNWEAAQSGSETRTEIEGASAHIGLSVVSRGLNKVDIRNNLK
jgi:hypothetical protein